MAFGPWKNYVESWRKNGRYVDFRTRYEDLHMDALNVLRDCLEALGAYPVKPIDKVVVDCSFTSLRQRAKGKEGEVMAYGRDLQLHHLRKGHVADWKNHYNRDIGEFAHRVFWPMIRTMGYERNEQWWLNLPIKI
jgi:hypothetical protein